MIAPAAVFMGALIARPAPGAEQIVMWYSARMWTLWLLLLALPFAAFLTGIATLMNDWRMRPATLLVAAQTLAAAVILAIVVLHMAAN